MRFVIFLISLWVSSVTLQVNAQILGGSYTIGGTNPDYVTWNEAIDSLHSKGIVGPVVFNVRPGIYEEQVNITSISGVSETNTITFQSESNDSSDVTLIYNANPSAPYTLQLNGVKYIKFRNLTFEGKNSNHARTVIITNGSRHLNFENNQFKGIYNSTSSNLALVFSPDGGSPDDSIRFENNYFYRGSFGLYFQSPSSGEKGIVVKDNVFENQYTQAIYLYRQRSPQVVGNHITTSSNRSDFYGIHFNQVKDDFKINNNYVHTNGGYGVSISSCASSVGKEGLVANNFVVVGGTSTAIGIYVYYSNNQLIYHNNVNITSTYNSGSAIYFYYSNFIHSFNNNFVNSGSGYSVTDYNSSYSSDYNNLYTFSNRFAYKSVVIGDLLSWKNATSQDSNSVSVDPVFISETDLHVSEAALYKSGLDTLGIEEDFDYEPRDVTQPSIGADEFTLPANDAGIVQIKSPNLPFKLGEQKIIVALRNFGSTNLSAVTINWNINDGETNSYSWTGNLSPSDTDFVEIGSYVFDAGENYTITTNTDLPNNSVDANLENDQYQLRNLYSGLSGTYTIGGVSPDFENFDAAIKALSEGGVVDEVIFNIRPGTYTEQLILPAVPGNSCDKSIVFQSENGDRSSVVVTRSNSSSSNYICLLDGVSGVTFRNLTFEATHQSYGTVFYFDRGTRCNTFENNVIKNNSNGTSVNQALVNSSSSNDYNMLWVNNHFEKGSYALYLQGDNAREYGNRIEGNIFEGQSYRGIYLYNQTSPLIQQNIISADGNRSDYIGVYLYYCYDSIKVIANKVYSENGGSGIYEYVCYGSSSKYGVLANNFIAFGGAANSNGIVTSSSSYQKVYNNSIHIYSSNTESKGFHNSSGSNIILKNNIFSNSGGGYAIYTNNRNIDSDYNNLYSSGSKVGYYSSVKNTLKDWQQSEEWDLNSISVNPLFVSDTNLHVNKADLDSAGIELPEITVDIDGELRGTPPDIGADEFTPSGTNAALISLDYPQYPFAAGTYPIKAVLKNSGVATLKTVQVKWAVKGELQEEILWQGELLTGEIDSLYIGDVEFQQAIAYDINVWIELVNSSQDIDDTDDSLAVDQLYSELIGGTYSVGDSTSDFVNFRTLADVLNKGGISGPLTFKVKQGTYEEQFVLRNFSGNNCDTPIIFEPEKGDSSVFFKHSNNSSNNYIVYLKGVSGVTFKHVVFEATNSSYARIFQIDGGSDCISFEKNIFKNSTSGTSANQALVFSNSGTDNYCKWVGNYFEGGSYALYLDGASRETGTHIADNIFHNQSYRGVYLYNQNSSEVKNNVFTSAGNRNDYVGVYLYYVYDSLKVTSNKIYSEGGGNGIYQYVCYGSSGKEGLTANNFISIGGTSTANGITLSSSSYQKIYHNNVNVYSSHSTNGRAFFNSNGSNLTVRNNVFANTGNGYAVYTNNKNLNSDYNNFYSEGEYLAYYSSGRRTLEDWKGISNWDSHSISANPLYAGTNDLHVNKADLDSSGIAVAEITTDIDGELRGTPPDIGADEFTPSGTNGALMQLLHPESPFAAGNYPIQVILKNSGVSAINSTKIKWSVREEEQTDFTWSGLINTGESDTLTVGSVDFEQAKPYNIKVWIETVNGTQDLDNADDTLTVEELYTELSSGTYTLGDSLSDFLNFTTLAKTLNKGGISGPLTFNIKAGVYNEQVVFTDFPGNSCDTPLIFQPEKDTSEVVVKYSNSSSNNYVVYLRGVSGFVFKGITFEPTNYNYGIAINLAQGASCNRFENNTFKGLTNGSRSSTNQALIYSGTSVDADNIWINNFFEGGSYGIYMSASGTREDGNSVLHNVFKEQSYRSISLENQNSSLIKGNTITSSGSRTDYSGIHLYYCYDSVRVLQNVIYNKSGGYGIYQYVCYGTTDKQGLIANNFITVGGANTAYGILHSSCSYQQIYNNNIHIISTHKDNGRAYVNSSSSNIELLNNILVNSGGGYSIHTNNKNINSDYNNLYSTGDVGYYSGSRTTLTDWQSATEYDLNSLSVNPTFFSDTNLHVLNVSLNGTGLPLASIKEDIDGQKRDPLTPDVGADEFSSALSDVSLVSVTSPVIPFAKGNNEVKVNLVNNANSVLTRVTINWLVNGDQQQEYNWQGQLLPGEDNIITIGEFNFLPDTVYSITAWSSLPNGSEDENPANDSTRINYLYAALSGEYKIGGQDYDFENFTKAVEALNRGGVIGEVTFKVSPEIYNEQFTISEIKGTSENNTITFTPAVVTDTNSVVLKYTTSNTNNYIVDINGADFITFENLFFKAEGTNNGRIIWLHNGASDITFKSNVFEGIKTSSTSTASALIYSGNGSEHNNQFIENTFLNGTYGLYLEGASNTSHEEGLVIKNNLIKDQSYMGVRLQYAEKPEINNNNITANGARNDYYGLYLSYCNKGFNVKANEIIADNGSYGVYINNSTATSSAASQFVNNFVSITGGSTVYGIYLINTSWTEVYFNNVYLNSPQSASAALYAYNGGQIKLINNILSNAGNGYAIYARSNTAIQKSDFNNLYTNGSTLGYWSGNRTDIVLWKLASGQDDNSLSVDPLYYSAENLHVRQALLNEAGTALAGITIDIDGEVRSTSRPDIGADEFVGIANDLSIVKLSEPKTSCDIGKDVPLTLTIQNYGSVDQTGFSINYTINDSVYVEEIAENATLEAGETFEYSFTQKPDLSSTGDYSITVVVQSIGDENPSNDTLKTIITNHPPISTVLTQDTSVCKSNPIKLSISGGKYYAWSNGAGGGTITVAPTEPTTYYVITENGLGCKRRDSVFVDIRTLPMKPQIIVSDSNVICKGDSVMLQTNFTDNILWSTGEISPVIYVKQAGNYSVATSLGNGCEESSEDVKVSYFSAPKITVLPSNIICEGDSVEITIAEAETYNWSIGDTTNSIMVSPEEISTYVVQGKSQHGCDYKDSVTVNVVPLPEITLVSSDTSICKSSSLTLNVDGVATTYKWSSGQSGKQIQVNPSSTTVYSVVASNGLGCSATDTASLTVQVVDLPEIPVVEVKGSTELCSGDSVQLSSANGEVLRWSNGKNASEIYVSTDASISATTTDANGCSSTSEIINVTTGLVPVISVNGNTILCRGDSVELSVENGKSYTWSTGDTTKTIQLSPAETSVYTLLAENALGCSYSDTIRIEVINPSAPDIVSDMIPADATLNLSNPLNLSWKPVENSGAYDVYIWKETEQQPEIPSVSNTTKINVSVDKLDYGTNYLWRVKAKNSCNSTMGNLQTFQLRELPDLIVEDIQIPSVAFATSTLSLSWIIRNKGEGSTISKQWNDEVYLSNDTVLSYNDVKLGTKNRLNFLSQGQAYTQSATFNLPSNVFGDYYVIVSIKGYDLEETETNNNRSYAFPLHVTIPETPDLDIISLGAPEIAFGGDEITVTYGVKNIGTAEAKGKKVTDRVSGTLCPNLDYTEWIDALYISDVETFHIDDAEQLSTSKVALRKERYSGNRCYDLANPEVDITENWYDVPDYLSVDSIYYRSFKVKIPHTYNGTYYLAVQADKDKNIKNEIFNSNNRSESIPITINLTPPPNLVVTEVGAPSSGFSGQEIDINWAVKNVGANAPVEKRWLDKYYISKLDTFNLSHTTEIGYQVYTQGSSLSPDSSYSVNKTITLPHGISGQYYLYVVTDAAKQVFEHVYDDDNVLRSAIPIEVYLSAFPDLALQQIQIEPANPNQGDTIHVTYQAKNIGDTLVYKNWIDTYGLVTDTNSADYRTILHRSQASKGSVQINNAAGLDSSVTYSHSFNMKLPLKLYGDHYLRVHLNSDNELYEHLHTENNLINYPVTIKPVYSDLELTVNTEFQDSYFSGQQIVFNHSVKNIGDAFTDSEKWWDYVYLSSDQELQSSDLQLAKTQHNGVLSAGKTYSSKLTTDIPNGISGSYYLIFTTGVDFNYYRQIIRNPANDTIRQNNYKVVPVEISIPNTPDLVVGAVNAVEEAFPGERIEVNCTIKNQGTSSTKGAFIVSTWISSSPVLQGQSYRLAGSRVTEILAPGEELSLNITSKIPGNITGNYYLIVEVDDYDNQFEYEGEDNNLSHTSINIKQPLPADLVLSEVMIPTNVIPGEEVSVSYKIKNEGTGKALGSIRDITYFSEDVLLDETLDEILRSTDYYMSLAPGESVERSTTYKMPGVLPGEYYGIARTNATQSMYEVDYQNNIDVSANTLQTDIPVLTLDKSEKFGLDYRDNKYYRVDLEANLDLMVDLESNLETGTNYIYIAYNRVPSPDDYDYKYTEDGVPSHSVLVPQTKEGTYYILVSTPDSYYGNQTMTITPKALPFSILDLKANVLGQGIASNYVTGAGFRDGIQFYLLKAGTNEVYAQAIVKEFFSSMRLLLRWDLSNVPLGLYDVKAVNINGEEVIKENAITVETKQTYEVVYGTDAPTSGIRQGNIGTWKFTIKSISNIDIPYLKIGVFYPAEDQLVEFKTSENIFKLSDNLPDDQNGLLSNFNTWELDGANDVGFGDFNIADLVARDIKPGEIVQVQISVRATRYRTYPVGLMYLSPESSSEYIEEETEYIEEIRQSILDQKIFDDEPDYFALVNDPNAFRDTLLNYNYIRTGLIDDKELSATFDFSPGNSPGVKDYPVIFFHKRGNYLWEINDVNGEEGSDPGWDLLTSNGSLTVNSTSSEPFTVKLASLNKGNTTGTLENWDPSVEQCWPIVIAQGGIVGFSTNKFRIETSDFGRYNSFYGDFSLKTSEDTLLLCYEPGNDMDGDGVINEEDGCPLDSAKTEPGLCGCNVSDILDTDMDGTIDCLDECPDDPNKTEPGECGCGVADLDSDNDGVMDCNDQCPSNPDKTESGECGCLVADTDSDGDGTPDCIDQCPSDANKVQAGTCGCGIPDIDSDNDGVADCDDACPNDPNKVSEGTCGCGVPDTDSDGDGTPDCIDSCPNDPNKTNPGICGCGEVDVDSDGDGVYDCEPDACPNDPNKNDPGVCGCGVPDTDSDGDGTPDCIDPCPNDPNKTNPGTCGCGTPDTDSDGDGTPDCHDNCPNDPGKTNPGTCGCGTPDTDSDGDGTPDCQDDCPENSDKTSPGICGCDEPDSDNDGDGVLDCEDECHFDPEKSEPGECGCWVPDTDSDGDGTPDCKDKCPNDPDKINPGTCGCGIPDTDSDGDGVPDCQDGCHTDPNKTEPGYCGCEVPDDDSDGDGTPDCEDLCPGDPEKTAPGKCGCGVSGDDCDLGCFPIKGVSIPGCDFSGGVDECCNTTKFLCQLAYERFASKKKTCLKVSLACAIRGGAFGPWGAAGGALGCYGLCVYAQSKIKPHKVCSAVSGVLCVTVFASCDPNEIAGPQGYGDKNWVTGLERMPYTIYYENDPELATAPAQRVEIVQPIDSKLDPLSFRLKDFGFGDYSFEVPENVSNYTKTLDLSDSLGILLQVTAGIDVINNEAFWLFQSIDPNTGVPPLDPFSGFLPINDSLGSGQGFVNYTILPKKTTLTGDSVTAQAEIIFDDNAPIETNTWMNTLDFDKPTSTIIDLPAQTTDSTFTVRWEGEDLGAGIKYYNLLYSTNDGPFYQYSFQNAEGDSFAADSVYTSVVFKGKVGEKYAFYTQAVDSAGNEEPVKTMANEITVGKFINTAPTFTINEDSVALIEDFTSVVSIIVTPDEVPDQDTSQIVKYSLLPESLDFVNIMIDSLTGEITIVAKKDGYGNENIRIIANDGQKTNATDTVSFKLNIVAVNDAPIVNGEISDKEYIEEDLFSWYVQPGLFTDVDIDDTLSYSAYTKDGDELPVWLNFDADSLKFYGKAEDDGVFNIILKATDLSGESVETVFTITVQNRTDIMDIHLNASKTKACITDVISFNVSLDNAGTNPVYSWLLNGEVIENADSSYYESGSFKNGDQIAVVVSAGQDAGVVNPLDTSRITVLQIDEIPGASIHEDGLVLTANEAFAYQWYKDGSLMNFTDRILVVDNSGDYVVKVITEGGCTAISDTVRVKVNGLTNELFEEAFIKIYPNPNVGEFEIVLLNGNYNSADIKILSVDGRLIQEMEFRSGVYSTVPIDISSEGAGLYLVIIELDNRKYIQKIEKY